MNSSERKTNKIESSSDETGKMPDIYNDRAGERPRCRIPRRMLYFALQLLLQAWNGLGRGVDEGMGRVRWRGRGGCKWAK